MINCSLFLPVVSVKTELIPECEVDEQCGDTEKCVNQNCVPACGLIRCVENAFCIAANHTARCRCITGYAGDGGVECSEYFSVSILEFLILKNFSIQKLFLTLLNLLLILINDKYYPLIDFLAIKPVFLYNWSVPAITTSPPEFRTDFPQPEMVVNCLADGVLVDIRLDRPGWDGVLYVKGYSDRQECRRVITGTESLRALEFKVEFSTCGLIHANVSINILSILYEHK